MKKHTAFLLAMLLVLGMATAMTTVSAAGPYTDTSQWTLEVSSDMGGTIGRAFDGNTATYWHSNYVVEDGKITSKDECPHTITVTFPEALEISAVRYLPRQKTEKDASSSGVWKKAELYGSADGKNFTKLADASYAGVDQTRAATDTAIARASYKAIRIVVTDSVNGYGTAAEIQMINPSGTDTASGTVETSKPASPAATTPATSAAATPAASAGQSASGADIYDDTSKWTIEASSERAEMPISRAFDNNPATYWHSNYVAEAGKVTSKEECPHTITVTFPEALEISAVRYLPRQKTEKDASTSGVWKKAEIYGSTDGKNFTKLTDVTYTWESQSRDAVDVAIAKASYKAIRIVVTDSVNGYGTAAEIQMVKPNSAASSAPAASKGVGEAYTIDSGWTVEASGARPDMPISRAFDDNPATYWHSNYIVEDGKITSKDECPHTITVTFPEALEISAVRYLPRQKAEKDASASGIWKKAEIYGSTDGKNFTKLADASYAGVDQTRAATDTAIAKASYKAIRIVVTDSVNGYATAAEISFVSSGAASTPATQPATQPTTPTATEVVKKKTIRLFINNKNATIDGKASTLATEPVIAEGRTLVPIRFVSEALGAEVSWDGETRSVTIVLDGKTIKLVIDQDEATVDGASTKLDVPAQIRNSSTMVPIRFVSEALGAEVSWNGDTQMVTIIK